MSSNLETRKLIETEEGKGDSQHDSDYAATVRQGYLLMGTSASVRPSSERRSRRWRSQVSKTQTMSTLETYARYYRITPNVMESAEEAKPSSTSEEELNEMEESKEMEELKEIDSVPENQGKSHVHSEEETKIESIETVAIPSLDNLTKGISNTLDEMYESDRDVEYIDEEDSFINQTLLPDDDSTSSYSGSLLGRANSAGLGMPFGSSELLKSWLPGLISAMPSDAQSAAIPKNNRIYEIINSVPANCIKNADSGLLSLLFAGSDEEESKLIEDNLSSTIYTYAQMSEPEEKRTKIFELLFGSERFGAAGQMNNRFFDDEILIGDDPVASLPKVPFDYSDPSEDTTLEILKFLKHLSTDEKKEQVYEGEAWWMEGLDHVGVPPIEDILKLDFDSDTYSGLKQENKILDSLKDDDDSLEDDHSIDWDERLWEAARQHYRKAYPDSAEESYLEISQYQLSEFRSCMISCLAVYARTFHVLNPNESNPTSKKNVDKGITVTEYVPMDLAEMIFQEVARSCHGDDAASDPSSVYIDGRWRTVEAPNRRHSLEIYVSTLLEALMGGSLGCFDIFEVELVNSTGEARVDSQERKQVKSLHQEDVDDRALVDEFLYGDTALQDNSSPFDRKKVENKQTVQKPCKDIMKEIRLRQATVTNILNNYQDFYRDEFDTLMPDLMARILEKEKRIADLRLSEEDSGEKSPSASVHFPIPLSTVYASKYAVLFTLRGFTKDQNDYMMIDTDDDATSSRLRMTGRAQLLLLNSFFIRQRIRIYGSFVAVKDHIQDWLSVLTFMQDGIFSIETVDRVYFDDNGRKDFYLVHDKLDSELKRAMDAILAEMKEVEREVRGDEDDGNPSLLLKEAVCTSYVSRLIGAVYRLLEIGRAYYKLGFDLGKSEQLLNLDRDESSSSDLEISDYQLAIKSYQEANGFLQSCKGAIESINKKYASGTALNFENQSQSIKDLIISSDLHLADTYIALGYCTDVKLRKHDQAMSHYREALKLYRHLGNKHFVFIDALQNLGAVHFEGGKYNESLKCYKHRLQVLQRMEKDPEIQVNSKRKRDTINKIQREISLTMQNIGRVLVKLGNRDLAIKQYVGSIERMRDLRDKCELDPINSLCPKSILDESLCELSVLHTNKASALFTTWTEGGLREMFGPRPSSNLEPYNFDFSVALGEERRALNCLDESLHLRLGLKEYEGHSMRYNFRHLLDFTELSSANERGQLRLDLTRNAILKFRHRQYKESELDILFTLNMHLFDDLSEIQKELPMHQLQERVSSRLISQPSSYGAVLPILFQLGTLYARLQDLEKSVSFFQLCLQLCGQRFAADETTPDELLGIQLDLADIHRNLGFIYLQQGELKLAATNLRAASRLLDSIINESSEDVETDFDEFLLEVHVKVSIVMVLNYLGRVYDQRPDTLDRGLVCFEDSMIILEDILDEFNLDGELFRQMGSIRRIVRGSYLQRRFSLLSLGRILGDDYYRAGKIYMQNSLYVDAELAFHRSINIFDVLKDEQYFSRDDGSVEDYDSDKLHRDLLDACKKALALLDHKDVPDGTHQEGASVVEDDELTYSVEDLLFRIGNCHGEMGEFDQALEFLHRAKRMTKAALGSQNFIVASILHNIGSVQRSKFLHEDNEDARLKALYAFHDATEISSQFGQYELFMADSMHRAAEMQMGPRNCSTSEAISYASDDQLLDDLECALEIRVRCHGDFHADVSLTRYLLGKLYYFRNEPRHALHHLDLALAQWQDLFTSVNLEIFDAIFFRGLCHQKLASAIEESRLRRKELDAAAKYFRNAINHSNNFYLAASSSVLPDSTIHRSCLIQSIQCALQLLTVSDGCVHHIQNSISQHLNLLSTTYHVMAYFDNDDGRFGGVDILLSLAAKIWMQIAMLYQYSNQSQAILAAMTAAVDLYTTLSEKDASFLLDKTIFQLMLAREYMSNAEVNLSVNTWREVSATIVKLCGKESAEAASVLMYIGSMSDISQAPRYFQGARRLFKQQDKIGPNIISPGTHSGKGQRGILYKNLACINVRDGQINEAMENISRAITIIEQMRQLPSPPHALPETLEEAFMKIEDWDMILLECYTLCLQIARSLFQNDNLQVFASDIFNRIAYLLGEIEIIEQSFQCFYSLLLRAFRFNGETNADVANYLFNMANIAVLSGFQPGPVILFEEFYSLTSAVIGNSLTLLPCVMVLANNTLKSCDYSKAMKWADIGFTSLSDTTTFEDEAMKLIAIKSFALTKVGKLNPAKRLLQKAKESLQGKGIGASDIHWALGQVNSMLMNPQAAGKEYYECIRLRQDCRKFDDMYEVHCAIGELLATHKYPDEARKHYVYALSTTTIKFGDDHVSVADCLHGLAKVSVRHADAQKYFLEAMRIYRLHGRMESLARSLTDLGTLYEKDRQINVAQNHYKEALNVLDSNRCDISLQTRVLQKSASISYRQEDYKSAARNFELLITLAKKIDDDKNNLGDYLYWFGCASYFLGRHDICRKSLETAIKWFKHGGKRQQKLEMIILTRLAQGKNHIKVSEADEARWSVDEAMRLTKKEIKSFAPNDLINFYSSSGEIYKDLGDFERSIEFTKKGIKLEGIHKKLCNIDEHLRIIELYLEVGEYIMAREHTNKIMNEIADELGCSASKMSLIYRLSGDIELELGEIDAAIRYYEKSISSEQEPTMHTYEVMLNLAKCKRIKRHWESSLETLLEAEEAASFMVNSKAFLIRVRLERAKVFYDQGNLDPAMAIYASTIGDFEELELNFLIGLELKPIELVGICTQIGASLVGDPKLSEKYLQKALHICSSDEIENKILSKQAWPELLEAYKVLIEKSKAQLTLGEERTELSCLHVNVGNILIRAKEFKQAIVIFEDFLDRKEHEDDQLQYVAISHNLGSCHLEIGNVKRAIPILEQALTVGKAVLGHDHVDVADTLLTLAEAYEISSGIEASISFSQSALKVHIDAYGMENVKVLRSLHVVGKSLLAADRVDGAIMILQDALRIQKRLPQQRDRFLLNTTHFLIAQAFIFNESSQLALRHLNLFLKNPYKRSSGIQVEIATALYQIGNVHFMRGKKSKADQYYEKSMAEICTQINLIDPSGTEDKPSDLRSNLSKAKICFPNEELKFADLIALYGVLLKQNSRYNESLVCLSYANEIFTEILKPSSYRISEVSLEKGRVYSELKEYSNASLVLGQMLPNCLSPKTLLEATRLLGICESKLGHTEKSVALLSQSVAMKRQFPTTGKEVDKFKDREVLFVAGYLNYEQNQILTALDFYKRCSKLFRSMKGDKSRKSMLEVAIATGNAYLKGGSPFRALMSFEQALFNARGIGSNLAVCESLSSMGNLYCELGRFEDAIENFTQCLRLQQDHFGKEHESTAQTLISLAATLCLHKKYDQSEITYMKAIDVLKNCYGNCKDVGNCWLKIAAIHKKQNDILKAISCFEEGMKIITVISLKDENLWDVFYGLGQCYLSQQEYKKALLMLSKALNVLPSTSPDNLKRSKTLLNIGIIQGKMGDLDLSLQNIDEAIKVNFSGRTSKEEAEILHQGIDIALDILRKRYGTFNIQFAQMMEKKAICLATISKYSAAVASHTEALKVYRSVHGPSHISVKNSLFNIGLCLNSLGKPEKAKKCLEQAYKLTKNLYGEETLESSDILFHIGISNKLEGNCTEARSRFDESIRIRKDFPENGKILAETFEAAGDSYVVQGARTKCINIAEKNYSESLRLYRNLGFHDETASLHFKLGNLDVKRGKFKKAVIHFEKSLVASKVLRGAKGELIAELYLNLGIAHDSTRNFTKAITCFDSCIEMNQLASTKAILCKGIALSKIGLFDEALNSLSIAIERATDQKVQADAHVARGHIFDMMNDSGMALECYSSALLIYRTQSDSEELVSSTCQDIASTHMRENRFNSAQTFAQEAFEIRKSKWGMEHYLTAESLYHRGSIFFAKKEWEQSLSCLVLALFTFKNIGIKSHLKANSLYMIGCAQEKVGQLDKSLDTLKQALVLHKERNGPDHIDVARTSRRLGFLYQTKGEYSKSQNYLNQSLRISINSLGSNHKEVLQVYEYLAETLCSDKKYSEAIRHISKAISIHEGIHGKSLVLARCYGLHGTILDQASNPLIDVIHCYKNSKALYELLLKDKPCDAETKEDYLNFASIIFKLAIAQERAGKNTTATKNYAAADRLYKKAMKSSDTLYHADVLEKLANLKGREKKYDKACVLLEETLRIRIKVLGMNNESVARALYSLGILFSKKHEYNAALKTLTDCLSIQQGTLGKKNIETADTLHAIGQCLGNTGEYHEAVNVFNEAYNIYIKHENGDLKLKVLKRDLDLGYRLVENAS